MLVCGLSTPMTPVTPGVMEEHGGVIRGNVEVFSFDGNVVEGACCTTQERENFTHPSLFRRAGGHLWLVELRLVGDDIELRSCRDWTSDPIDEIVEKAAPVELVHTTVNNLLELASQLQRDSHCSHPECDGAKGRELNLRRAVLVLHDEYQKLVCAHCHRIHSDDLGLILHGGTIPPQMSVPLFNRPARR